MEAIGHAGTCLGILASDGIVLAAERRNTNKLLDEAFSAEKIYKLHEYVDLVVVKLMICVSNQKENVMGLLDIIFFLSCLFLFLENNLVFLSI